jgi:phosphotransferase system IIA component
MSVDTAENNITQVRIDIGELKGILNTVVTTHAEQIRDVKVGQVQLRSDLTAVKDNAVAAIAAVATTASTNSENIKDMRDDIKKVEEKQNATFGKTLMILSPILAAAALLWNIIGGKA